MGSGLENAERMAFGAAQQAKFADTKTPAQVPQTPAANTNGSAAQDTIATKTFGPAMSDKDIKQMQKQIFGDKKNLKNEAVLPHDLSMNPETITLEHAKAYGVGAFAEAQKMHEADMDLIRKQGSDHRAAGTTATKEYQALQGRQSEVGNKIRTLENIIKARTKPAGLFSGERGMLMMNGLFMLPMVIPMAQMAWSGISWLFGKMFSSHGKTVSDGAENLPRESAAAMPSTYSPANMPSAAPAPYASAGTGAFNPYTAAYGPGYGQ